MLTLMYLLCVSGAVYNADTDVLVVCVRSCGHC